MSDERVGALTDEQRRRIDLAAAQLGGAWWTKVPLAGPESSGWLLDAPSLYIDAMWFPDQPALVRSWSADPEGFVRNLTQPQRAVAAVCRGYADRTIFGLLLAAQDLLPVVAPTVGRIGGLAVIDDGKNDANVTWAYRQRGFGVFELDGVGS